LSASPGGRKTGGTAAGKTAGDGDSRWRDWIGRGTVVEDRIDAMRVRALQAALDDEGAPLGDGDPLPPLWHWLHFWAATPGGNLGDDGHARTSALLPPIDLPRRMWAGSRLRFHAPLPIGAPATRHSRVADVVAKEGRSGPLVFLSLHHEMVGPSGLCIAEEQDIVYRAAPRPGEAPRDAGRAPESAAWRREVTPDPVLLFRYSALTFNGHRIHYDRPFATETEGYPGLVVHGPLLATLMVDLARRERPSHRVARFAFQALRPLFDGTPLVVAGAPEAGGRAARVWVADDRGNLAAEGRIDFD